MPVSGLPTTIVWQQGAPNPVSHQRPATSPSRTLHFDVRCWAFDVPSPTPSKHPPVPPPASAPAQSHPRQSSCGVSPQAVQAASRSFFLLITHSCDPLWGRIFSPRYPGVFVAIAPRPRANICDPCWDLRIRERLINAAIALSLLCVPLRPLRLCVEKLNSDCGFYIVLFTSRPTISSSDSSR